MGKWELSRDFLKSGMDQGLPDELKREAARSYANTLKKQDQWSEALEYWEFAAEMDDYRSCIELAKFYEHRDRNIQFALKWVERAALLSIDPKYDPDDLKCRKARLKQKSEKEENEDKDLHMVWKAEGYLEAQLIKSYLESMGIEVYDFEESVVYSYGLNVGPLSEVELYVRKDQADEADRYMKQYLEARDNNSGG
jgi:tetratricopeptide (TPR) repeat protein